MLGAGHEEAFVQRGEEHPVPAAVMTQGPREDAAPEPVHRLPGIVRSERAQVGNAVARVGPGEQVEGVQDSHPRAQVHRRGDHPVVVADSDDVRVGEVAVQNRGAVDSGRRPRVAHALAVKPAHVEGYRALIQEELQLPI